MTLHSDVDELRFSPNSKTLYAGFSDNGGGIVRLWDVTDPANPSSLGEPLIISTSILGSMTLSQDGKILCVGLADGAAQLYDTTVPNRPVPLGRLRGSEAGQTAVAFTPDAAILAAALKDGTIRLWDMSDPGHPDPTGGAQDTGKVHSMMFSPNGRTLAGAVDAGMQLWDATKSTHLTPLSKPVPGVNVVAFSPDGRTLATGDGDGTVTLRNVTDPANPTPLAKGLPGGGGTVYALAFSPDSHSLATGGFDGTLQLWHLPESVLTGHTDMVVSAVFDPEGSILASVDGITLRLWDVTDPAHPVPLGDPLQGKEGLFGELAFSPDGKTLALSDNVGMLKLWDVADPVRPRRLGKSLRSHNTSTELPGTVAFSPDGKTLASGSQADGSVRLWNVGDPARAKPLGRTGDARVTFGINAVTFSPNGNTLAVTTSSNAVRLWDVREPVHPEPLGKPLTVNNQHLNDLVFSHDGKTLAVADNEREIRLWDVHDPAHSKPLGKPLTGPTAPVRTVLFNPTGTTLVGGDDTGSLYLWDVKNPSRPKPLGEPLTSPAEILSLAFNRDGGTLPLPGCDQAVRLWPMDASQTVKRVCDSTGNALTHEVWQQHLPGVAFKAPCP